MTVALWLAIVALAAGQIATFIMQRKRIMDLEQSLTNAEEFHANAVQSVLQAIDTIPALITDLATAVIRKALDEYIAEHPEGGGTISDDRIIEHVQTITEQSKPLLGLAASIKLPFDQMKATGDPSPPAGA